MQQRIVHDFSPTRKLVLVEYPERRTDGKSLAYEPHDGEPPELPSDWPGAILRQQHYVVNAHAQGLVITRVDANDPKDWVRLAKAQGVN